MKEFNEELLNIKKYNKIIQRYRTDEFGKKYLALQKQKQSEVAKITIKDYLENIANILTKETGKEYTIKCFTYPIVYEFYGSHKDSTLGGETKQEGVITITTKEFDVKDIWQGYLCYPEEYAEFYEKGEFILCFGPDEKFLNFEQTLQEKISDSNLDIYKYFYGLPKIDKDKVLTYKN